jgi:7-cyano-7-deazaguanine synthase
MALSGGVDSSTMLYLALARGRNITPVFFSYGSKHQEYERRAASSVATKSTAELRHGEGTELIFVDLQNAFAKLGIQSSLLKGGGLIPEGHYTDWSMRQTIVPCRNFVFVSLLGALAESINAKEVWLGTHSGDHEIYPDCRADFIGSCRDALTLATDGEVDLVTPFLSQDKRQIVHEGIELNVPYELTRTCYKDQELACGKCGSCVERLEAFKLNRATDPIKYEE